MWKNHAFAQKQKQNLAPNIFTKWNIIIIIITQTLNYVLKGFTVFPSFLLLFSNLRATTETHIALCLCLFDGTY